MDKTISGKEIKLIREKLELTQEDFAHLLKVTPKTIERWEYQGIKEDSTGASISNMLDLKTVSENKKGFLLLKETLNSAKGTVGITLGATLISLISPIIAGGIFGAVIGTTLISKVKEFLESPENSTKKNHDYMNE
jgi:transcriptional regulator with XRE-family HTH domain